MYGDALYGDAFLLDGNAVVVAASALRIFASCIYHFGKQVTEHGAWAQDGDQCWPWVPDVDRQAAIWAWAVYIARLTSRSVYWCPRMERDTYAVHNESLAFVWPAHMHL